MTCISVIIPAFKSDESIYDSVNSVVNQLEVEVEIIVVDNGLNGNILDRLSQNPVNLKIIKQKIQGAGPARNIGVDNSNNELIAFLDAGDTWESTKLFDQMIIPISDYELVGTYASFVTKNNRKIGTSIRTKNDAEATNLILKGLSVPALTSSWLMTKTTFNEVGGFDPIFRNTQDLDFLNRFALKGGTLRIIRKELVNYNISPSSLTALNYRRQFKSAEYIKVRNNETKLHIPDLDEFIEKHGNFPSNLWRKMEAGRLFRLAILNFGEGKYFKSILCAWYAFLLGPNKFFKKLVKQSNFLKF